MNTHSLRHFSLHLFLLLSLAPLACRQGSAEAGKPGEVLSIGIQNSPSNALIIIAKKKNFFDSTKVRVVIKEFSAGKLALQSMLGQAGDLDVAVCAETPIVLSSLAGNRLKVFTQIVKATNECRVVVQKDGTEDSPAAYFVKKRKLATSLGGSPEWFTYDFIKAMHLDSARIEIVAMLPENMPAALKNGAVDAISIFDPYARIGERELGANGKTFTNPSVISYYVMAAKENTLQQKGKALQELLTGLGKAQEFIRAHPGEARQIVARQTRLDTAILQETWGNYSFSVGLEQHFIDLCKDEAGWAIATGKYPAGTTIPDFRQIVYPNLLDPVPAGIKR